jgi:20S proteasome alpha/beta subunit
MIIQSPEMLIYKKEDAKERVDKYLLILVVFKNGLAFGAKFNERQSNPGQWLMGINSACIVAGIGALHNFESTMLALSDFAQSWSSLIGQHYLTGYGIKNFLSEFLRTNFEQNANALAVNFLVVDWRDENEPFLWFIDFDGSIKQLKNFAVAGGNDYDKPLTKEEIEKLTPEEKAMLDFQKSRLKKVGMPEELLLTPTRLRQPKKEAIAYLEKNWKPNMKKEEAIELVKKTLFECNPESHDKMIEIITIEYGKDAEPFYFKKTDKGFVQVPTEKILRE